MMNDPSQDVGRFIAGVGALVWRPPSQRYLLLRRAPEKDFASGIWECVTGRLQQGEGFEDGLHREVKEELGIDVQIDFLIGTTHFYRGDPRPENEVVGIVYCCSLEDMHAIHVSQEHDAHRWVTIDEAEALLTAGDASTRWTRAIIQRAEAIRALTGEGLLGYYLQNGFELE